MTKRLANAAMMLLESGFSVIPTQRDSIKIPSIKWEAYQHRRATVAEVESWLQADLLGGLAIVCGNLSKLIVLDIDDEETAAEFAAAFPHLLQTKTVKSGSRGLPHYYYHVDHAPATIHDRAGLDLQSNGAYVVTYPTMTEESTYSLIRGGSPRHLTPDDLAQLIQWIQSRPQREKPVTKNATPRGVAGQTITPRELEAIYTAQASEGNRNNALFYAALKARDYGIAHSSAESLLAAAHERTGRDDESLIARHREALRTISSAYSRPPRRTEARPSQQLWNCNREALLRANHDIAAMTLDALLIDGIEAGQEFTSKEIARALGHRADSYRVKTARAQLKEIGLLVENPPKPPVSLAGIEDKTPSLISTINAYSTGGQNRHYNRTQRYVMPTNRDLSTLLKVKPSRASDTFTADDIKAMKPNEYKLSILERFIARRPGKYTHGAFKHKLGVSGRTIRRYNSITKKYTTRPTYQRNKITFKNLDEIPAGIESKAQSIAQYPGIFLEIDAERAPLIVKLAVDALKQGKHVYLMRQLGNTYEAIPEPAHIAPVSAPAPARPHTQHMHTHAYNAPAHNTRTQENPLANAINDMIARINAHAAAERDEEQPPAIVDISKPVADETDTHTERESQPALIRGDHQRRAAVKQGKPQREPSFKRKLESTYDEETARTIYEQVNSHYDSPQLSLSRARAYVYRAGAQDTRAAWFRTVSQSKKQTIDVMRYFATLIRVQLKKNKIRG